MDEDGAVQQKLPYPHAGLHRAEGGGEHCFGHGAEVVVGRIHFMTDDNPAYDSFSRRFTGRAKVNHGVTYALPGGINNNQTESFNRRVRRLTFPMVRGAHRGAARCARAQKEEGRKAEGAKVAVLRDGLRISRRQPIGNSWKLVPIGCPPPAKKTEVAALEALAPTRPGVKPKRPHTSSLQQGFARRA